MYLDGVLIARLQTNMLAIKMPSFVDNCHANIRRLWEYIIIDNTIVLSWHNLWYYSTIYEKGISLWSIDSEGM